MSITYWKSSEDGHICVNYPCSPQSIPIVGYFTGNEELSQIKWITAIQESGLDRDHYCKSLEPPIQHLPLTTDEKRAILLEKKNEKPIYYISDIYKGILIQSIQDFALKMQTFYERGRVYSHSSFVPTITPKEFNYSVRGRRRVIK